MKEELYEEVGGAEEYSSTEEFAGGVVEKGIQKKFVDILYNQLYVNPYACTIVATATAISNFTWKVIPYSLMKDVWKKGVKEGWMKEWYGGKLNDGVHYMVEAYNKSFNDNIVPVYFLVTPSSLYEGLKKSPVVSGIYFNTWYSKDEQDDGRLTNGYTKGANGHAITFVKINTLDDTLVKFAQNYAWVRPYNVIYSNFEKNRSLFFNGGYYLTRQ